MRVGIPGEKFKKDRRIKGPHTSPAIQLMGDAVHSPPCPKGKTESNQIFLCRMPIPAGDLRHQQGHRAWGQVPASMRKIAEWPDIDQSKVTEGCDWITQILPSSNCPGRLPRALNPGLQTTAIPWA